MQSHNINEVGLASCVLKDPSWSDMVKYYFDDQAGIIYFKFNGEFGSIKNENHISLYVDSYPDKFIVTGLLEQVNQDDEVESLFKKLVGIGDMSEKEVRYALYDQRSKKPRKNNYKLIVKKVEPINKQ